MAPPWIGMSILVLLILSVLSEPLRADRAGARALTEEGRALEAAGELGAALDRYERAIRSDIDYLPSYENALPLWMRMGKLSTARARLESLTLRCPDCVFAWYALGALYRKEGRFDLAVLAYEAYLAKRPVDPDAHFGMAMALSAARDEKARAALARYLRLETRRDRAAYRAQAEKMLRELGGTPEELDPAPAPRRADFTDIRRLLDQGQLVSAESLLDATGKSNGSAIALRREIAERRGQWFQALCFRALGRLYGLTPAPSDPVR